jgi:hypothetical protein
MWKLALQVWNWIIPERIAQSPESWEQLPDSPYKIELHAWLFKVKNAWKDVTTGIGLEPKLFVQLYLTSLPMSTVFLWGLPSTIPTTDPALPIRPTPVWSARCIKLHFSHENFVVYCNWQNCAYLNHIWIICILIGLIISSQQPPMFVSKMIHGLEQHIKEWISCRNSTWMLSLKSLSKASVATLGTEANVSARYLPTELSGSTCPSCKSHSSCYS